MTALEEALDILMTARVGVYRDLGRKTSKVWDLLDHASDHITRISTVQAQDAAFDQIMSDEVIR